MVLASFTDVLGIVAGVLLALGGGGLVLMGIAAWTVRSWRGGALLVGQGLVAFAAGLWLVGVLG
jgi:hypothetical protein